MRKSKRDLLVRADSYLSLLWHRHTPPDIRSDVVLARDVERTISELRAAYSRTQQPAGPERDA